MAVIQLVLQIPDGIRFDLPGEWSPNALLADIMNGVTLSSAGEAAIRYLNTKVPQSSWSTTSLQDIGLTQAGKALLTLEYIKQIPPGSVTSQLPTTTQLEQELAAIFQNNFDADTKVCLVTMIKILDNILQQPGNEKVRSIRMTNPAFHEKVASRRGASKCTLVPFRIAFGWKSEQSLSHFVVSPLYTFLVEFLQACGFVRQPAPPQLLAKVSALGDDYLVLTFEMEKTSHLVAARQLLTNRAMQDLGMNPDELPAYKPPPSAPSIASNKRQNPDPPKVEFDPYRGHHIDVKAASVGARLGPEENYVSPTDYQLQRLQTQQKKLEDSMQQKLIDRDLVATLPSSAPPQTNVSLSFSSAPAARESEPSDAGLLAARQQRLDEERRKREEGGFTTKAMRDLEQMKKAKVYSHVQLRVQFRDGSAVHGKFLPKETLGQVKEVISSCFCVAGLDFDLYVAPPRRLLKLENTLQEEGLVPAAKILASWKVSGAPLSHASVGSFLKPELFRQGESVQAYPTAQAVASDGKASSSSTASDNTMVDEKPAALSREELLLQRMMGGKSGMSKDSSKGSSNGGGSGGKPKPKWFK